MEHNVTRPCDKCPRWVGGRTFSKGPVVCPNCKAQRAKEYNERKQAELKEEVRSYQQLSSPK